MIIIGEQGKLDVRCWVPRGSVIGPILWNIYYDGVLRIPVRDRVRLIAYADDLAILVSQKSVDKVEEGANRIIADIVKWLKGKRLKIAPEKTETVLLLRGRKQSNFKNKVETVISLSSIKYLRIYFDADMRMGTHAREDA